MWRIVSEAQRRLRIQSQPLSFAVKRVGKPGAVAWGQGKGPPLACFPCGMLKIPFRGEGGMSGTTASCMLMRMSRETDRAGERGLFSATKSLRR